MYTRRKFVIMGSMATTAVLALKPFKAASSVISPVIGLDDNSSKLIFLHTSSPDPKIGYSVADHISDIKSNSFNTIVLHSGRVKPDYKQGQPEYDFCIDEIIDYAATNSNYKIIRKGNIKTGLISAKPEDADVIQKVNKLSVFLKKERGCNLVVCISQLGYKNKQTPDDITLAQQSEQLDIIVGGNSENYHKHPMILLNQNNEEVIIHSAISDFASIGKIAIDFNEKGQKKQIGFNNC